MYLHATHQIFSGICLILLCDPTRNIDSFIFVGNIFLLYLNLTLLQEYVFFVMYTLQSIKIHTLRGSLAIHGCLYNQALIDVRSTVAGIK